MSEQERDYLGDAQRLRELLRRTQTYVCSNRDLLGAAELCGEIAEAMAATKHLRPAERSADHLEG